MKAVKIAGLYIIAAVLFPWEWLREQPSVLHHAWLRTFAEAERMANLVRMGKL